MDTQNTPQNNTPMPPQAPAPDASSIGPDTRNPDAVAINQPQSENMTPEQMAANLTQLKNTLDDQMRLFNGKHSEVKSQLVEIQNKAIEALFMVLQQNGVNLEDRTSVNEFLQKLKDMNPEGYAIFEKAIDNLLSQKANVNMMQPPEGFAEPLNPMDAMSKEPHFKVNRVNDVGDIPRGSLDPNTQPIPVLNPPPFAKG